MLMPGIDRKALASSLAPESGNDRPGSTHVIRTAHVRAALGGLIVILLLGHLASITATFLRGRSFDDPVLRSLNLGGERNLPTFVSTCLLLACALMLTSIGFARRKPGKGDSGCWLGLAAIFAFLAADEFLSIHERIGGWLRPPGVDRYLHHVWLVPYGVILAIFAAQYFSFWCRLPRSTQLGFLGAALLMVGGAFGLEFVEGTYISANGGRYDATFVLFVTLEELLELAGCAVFLDALLRYCRDHVGPIQFVIAAGTEQRAGAAELQ